MISLKITFPKMALLLALSFCLARSLSAQTVSNDSLNAHLNSLQGQLNKMGRLKITGYIQSQFQVADSAGIAAPADGGNFAPGVDKRFMVRRGRIKFTYAGKNATGVFMLDGTTSGLNIKEAYVTLYTPSCHALSLTTGVFNRPFGFEVPYSSSLLESPERMRVLQTLLPGEVDGGAMLTFHPDKGKKLDWLEVDAGMFNGTGILADIDYQKDFIGRVRVEKSFGKFWYGIGLSDYMGGVAQANKFVYGDPVTLDDSLHTRMLGVDSAASNKGAIAKRNFMGADLELSYDFPFGKTELRGEFLAGTQPGSSSSSTTAVVNAGDTYLRKFSGYGIQLAQKIGKTNLQVVVKYDTYDPNTEVAGSDIGTVRKTGVTDIAYSTIGYGLNYYFSENVRLTAYYDHITNESTKLAKWTHDIKDDVFTLRVQFKF